MSKVLKFIVHFVVICTLICVLGLVLPPFFGVRTVIVDKSDKATNLPVGSVTYAIPEKSSAISAGTPILVQKDSETYKYTITNLDASKGTGTVTDQSVSGGKTFTIKVGDYVPKVVVTIGYVGYLMVATESIEGLIILGLVVLFLIILLFFRCTVINFLKQLQEKLVIMKPISIQNILDSIVRTKQILLNPIETYSLQIFKEGYTRHLLKIS